MTQNLAMPPDHEFAALTKENASSQGSAPELYSLRVSQHELPIFCPNPRMPLWSSHPKVFLELNEEGLAKCPYCGTRYQLDDESHTG